MSDLYLVLRNRLDSVPEWVYIETPILKSARESKGLSYESAGRELHISSKTYERYEKAGRIPRPLVQKVAQVLGLEVEEPAVRRVVLDSPEVRVQAIDELREYLGERLGDIERQIEALDRKIDVAVSAKIEDLVGALVSADHRASREV